MPARLNKSGTADQAAENSKHDLIVLLKEVISSMQGVCEQKAQNIILDSCPSKIMSLDKDSMFVLFRKLMTGISMVACRGAIIKISVFDCENEVLILSEYGTRSHYQRKDAAQNENMPASPFTASPGLDLLQVKNLARQLSWNLWTGGPVKNRGTRVFLSTAV